MNVPTDVPPQLLAVSTADIDLHLLRAQAVRRLMQASVGLLSVQQHVEMYDPAMLATGDFCRLVDVTARVASLVEVLASA